MTTTYVTLATRIVMVVSNIAISCNLHYKITVSYTLRVTFLILIERK
jgi:hypothetical protein